MYWGLIEMGFKIENISTYAPDRFTEGYGMNTEAADKLSLEYDLIISVDCGINSVDEAKIILRNNKADLIITDHHHLKTDIPNCVAVLNPRLSEHYFLHQDRIPKVKLENYLDIFDKEQISKIELWFEGIQKDISKFSVTDSSHLSSSVTGVGVSWFCLVWLAYFLQELDS